MKYKSGPVLFLCLLISVVGLFINWFNIKVAGVSGSYGLWDETTIVPNIFLVAGIIGLLSTLMNLLAPKNLIFKLFIFIASIVNFSIALTYFLAQRNAAMNIGATFTVEYIFILILVSLFIAFVVSFTSARNSGISLQA